MLSKALAAIPNPLLNEAISVTVLAGITGSASGDEHRHGGDVRDLCRRRPRRQYSARGPAPCRRHGQRRHGPLPHNGAVITLLAITGLSHRRAYGGIFAITVIKSLAVLFVIATFYVTGIV